MKKKIGLFMLCLVMLLGLCGCGNGSIKKQFDTILNSNKTEFIFFERKGNPESDKFKELLDNDLKEQGVIYTTIDVTNASYEDLEYFKEKLNYSSDNFDIYIAVINGSENLALIEYNDYDKTMFLLAGKNLLKDSKLILNKHYYNLGKIALEQGNIGKAKNSLTACKGYLDADEILNYKRFYLIDNEFEYSQNKVYVSFSYSGNSLYGSSDNVRIVYQDCRTVSSCINYKQKLWDAIMLNDTNIKLRESDSKENIPFNEVLDIEILSQNQIKLRVNGTTYTLTKKN